MRSAGVLLPIFSLPSRYGIGTLGREAYRFVDFLCRSGMKYWQILPLTPTGYGDSPYQSVSAFAGNPYLIDLDDAASFLNVVLPDSCRLVNEEGKISRYKIKDPSFNNWWGLSMATRNNGISDFPLCNKGFDLSYCGFDL